jgi:hypothetical protein
VREREVSERERERERDREQRDRRPVHRHSSGEYGSHSGPSMPGGPSAFYSPSAGSMRSPINGPAAPHRTATPQEPSPRSAHPSSRFWDNKPPGPPSIHSVHPHSARPSPPPQELPRGRYDPTRYDSKDYDMEGRSESRQPPSYQGSPEGMRTQHRIPSAPQQLPPSHHHPSSHRSSESPHPSNGNGMSSDSKGRRRNGASKDKETPPSSSQPTPSNQGMIYLILFVFLSF